MTNELSYDYVESGVILNIESFDDLRKVKTLPGKFQYFGDALQFINDFYDESGEIPTTELLTHKFAELDPEAHKAAELEYFIQEHNKQQTYLAVRKAITGIGTTLQEDPDVAIASLISKLEQITDSHDSEVAVYDSGVLDRLEEYRERLALRNKGLGIIGIPTPFKTLNRKGTGFLDGELFSLFARPAVGKSFLCLKAAALAAKLGHKTLFVTSEMPRKQMELRMDVIMAKMYKDPETGEPFEFSHKVLRSGEPGLDQAAYERFLKIVNKHQMLITDNVSIAAMTLEKIESLVRRHKPQFVVVDGIYLLGGEGNAVWEKDRNIVNGLKNLAMARNIPVFCSTQATRNAGDVFTHPKATDIANGDALLRNSDIAVSMALVDGQQNQRSVLYQKFRDLEMDSDSSIMHWDVDKGEIYEEDVS